MGKRKTINLTKAEQQSNHNRVWWAERLILQLPADHDGRNGWLLNYGVGEEAKHMRSDRGLPFNPILQAARTVSGGRSDE